MPLDSIYKKEIKMVNLNNFMPIIGNSDEMKNSLKDTQYQKVIQEEICNLKHTMAILKIILKKITLIHVTKQSTHRLSHI